MKLGDIDAQLWVAKDVSLTLSASSGFSVSVDCVGPVGLEGDNTICSNQTVPSANKNAHRYLKAGRQGFNLAQV